MLKGNLRTIPVADVFQSIHQNSLTGALAIRDKTGEWLVSFEEGYVTGCAPPEKDKVDKTLSGELVRQRVVDADAIGRASRFFKRKGSLKRSLKRRKLMTSGEFSSFARSVVLERIYECFLLDEGEYEFIEKYDKARFDDDEGSAAIRIKPDEILMEAMRRVDEFKRIKRRIPSWREVYVATRQGTEQDSTIQTEILSLTAAGSLDLDGVFNSLPCHRFAAAEAVLVLLEEGALRIATAPEYLELGKAAQDREELEQAGSYYARGLHYERGNPDLNERRFAVLEALGRNQEAADERKLYAGVLLEKGDKKAASEHYERAAELSSGDPLPLEKLLELQVEDKDFEGARRTASDLVTLYLKLGLGDSAKSVFPRVLLLKPKDRTLREKLAETHAALHEKPTGARIYKELAQEVLDEGQTEEAAKLLRKAVELQPDNEKTKALLEAVESGTHANKRRRRRRFVAACFFLLFLGLAGTWGYFEITTMQIWKGVELEALRRLARSPGPEGALGGIEDIQNSKAFQAQYARYTYAARWSRETAGAFAELYVEQARRSGQVFDLLDRKPGTMPWEEVDSELKKTLNAPGPGEPKFQDQLEEAEAALDAEPPDLPAAIEALKSVRARASAATKAIFRADLDARGKTQFTKQLEFLRGLTPRIHIAWGRTQVTLPEARAILDRAAAEMAKERSTAEKQEQGASSK